MGGFQVQPGAIAARAGTVDTAASRVAGVAGMIGGVDTGGMPPRTGAALESALAAWPGALRRLGTALDATAGALRSADGHYAATDGGIATAAHGTGAHGRP
jgi:hypothetical protein